MLYIIGILLHVIGFCWKLQKHAWCNISLDKKVQHEHQRLPWRHQGHVFADCFIFWLLMVITPRTFRLKTLRYFYLFIFLLHAWEPQIYRCFTECLVLFRSGDVGSLPLDQPFYSIAKVWVLQNVRRWNSTNLTGHMKPKPSKFNRVTSSKQAAPTNEAIQPAFQLFNFVFNLNLTSRSSPWNVRTGQYLDDVAHCTCGFAPMASSFSFLPFGPASIISGYLSMTRALKEDSWRSKRHEFYASC